MDNFRDAFLDSVLKAYRGEPEGFDPDTITFVTTVSDSGGPGSWTVHCGKLPDGRWVGWGPWQEKKDARLLNKDEIDYYGVERIKKCPTCGHIQ